MTFLDNISRFYLQESSETKIYGEYSKLLKFAKIQKEDFSSIAFLDKKVKNHAQKHKNYNSNDELHNYKLIEISYKGIPFYEIINNIFKRSLLSIDFMHLKKDKVGYHIFYNTITTIYADIINSAFDIYFTKKISPMFEGYSTSNYSYINHVDLNFKLIQIHSYLLPNDSKFKLFNTILFNQDLTLKLDSINSKSIKYNKSTIKDKNIENFFNNVGIESDLIHLLDSGLN